MDEQKNDKPANAPKQRVQPKIEAPAQPQRPESMKGMVAAAPRNRHDTGFRHDCFWADVQKCIQNNSYEAYKLDRMDIEHRHVYHSHSSQGKKNTRTGSNCGHYHQVEHYVDPVTGETIAKCGPAMRSATKMSARGQTYTVEEPVYFEQEVKTANGALVVQKVIDNHVHELVYQGYEFLSPNGINDALKEQRALAATMGITIDPQAVKDNTPAPMSPADGASIS